MRPKSKKNDPKSMSKNNTFLDSIFHRIFVVWASENASQIDFVSHFGSGQGRRGSDQPVTLGCHKAQDLF